MSRYGVNAPQTAETKNLLAAKDSRLSAADVDIESGYIDYSNFDVKYNIRGGFIKKVYGILCTQLLVSLAFIYACVSSPSVKLFVQTSPAPLFFSIIISFTVVIALTCFKSNARTHPNNVILLGIFTLAESYLLGVATSAYESSIVFQAVLLTAIIVTGLTIYAFNTNSDFTSLGPYLFVALTVLVLGGLLRLMLPHSPVVETVWAVFGALLFSFYIIFDTQMLASKHDPDDYVIAALELYLDIINLFLEILKLLGDRK